MKTNYLNWTELPYAGEKNPPTNPVTPYAGSWPLTYLKRGEDERFLDTKGEKLKLPITHPNLINFEKELRVVRRTLRNLTTNQRDIGIYYGTGVPTKQWTPVIDRIIDSYDVSPTSAARILASVQGAVNDTMIVVWDLKYRFDVARPNQYDQRMKTLLCTPRFPTYPSGHATMSACTATVLSYFFPKESRKLWKIASDNALSRLYAGVHFPSDNNEGLILGKFIGNVVVNHLKQQSDSRLQPIENLSRNFQDTDILPDDYQQFIPYDFPKRCTSLLLNENNYNHKINRNINAPKPYINS
ncbi:vanadium-dependent haloperoxidase [Virgibacillus sp. JSM 102003]|uniref:vanadium-dependent haloperoxidase n=1 Tax=Virgibacillus sp. JSM 102003 TaxID=1562108 RepID=UPI0035C0C675